MGPPYLPAAHLYLNEHHAVNPNGAFNHPDTVQYLPASYENTPASVRLLARDAAITAWPSRRTVLAVVPPIIPEGDTHFLELRRRDQFYDQGISSACVTILAANFFTGVTDPSALRLRYVDRIDLEGLETGFGGDLDYHSFGSHFVVRVSGVEEDFSAVDLRIAGGNAWQSFSLTLDEPVANRTPTYRSTPKTVLVAPCPVYPKREYSYRVNIFETFQVLRAHSAGYEKPSYAWYLEDVLLNSQTSPIALEVSCREVNGSKLAPREKHLVVCTFKITGGKLELNVAGSFAEIILNLQVTVAESSQEVLQNYYPERSLFTNLHVENLSVEWDAQYQTDAKACWKTLADANKKFQQGLRLPNPRRDPRPPWDAQIGTRELIRELFERDQRSAVALAAEVARRAGVSTESVLKDVFRNVE